MDTNDKIDQLYTQVQVMNANVKKLDKTVLGLSDNMVTNRIDIATLKVRAMIWGSFSGGVTTFIISALVYFVTKGK